MILEINEVCEFIPDWNENKKNADQIKVKYKNPTMPMYDKLIPKPQMVLKVGPDGKASGGETAVTIDNKAILLEMVTSIENLSFKVGSGEVVSIKTGKDLYGSAVPAVISGLVDEIGAFLQGVLSKKAVVDAKNSE
jgi:hypothetical protein